MAVNLKQLHYLLDNVDPAEYDILSKILLKFIPEVEPLPDEIETIKRIDAAVAAGELFDESAIDWN
jgi:hypothetical protein